MSARSFAERLGRYRKVGLDTAAFRLHLAGDRRHADLTLAVFDAIERGLVAGVASMLTLSELLVEPYKAKDEAAVHDFNVLLPTFPHLALVPLTQPIADKAAHWQARFGLSQATSIQAATAAVEGAEALVTANPELSKLVGELDIMLLEEYL